VVPNAAASRSADRKQNLVLCGPAGREDVLPRSVGAARRRTRPARAWFTLEDLGGLIRWHRADDTVAKAIKAILRAELIVVEDIGLLPVAPDAAEDLYRPRRGRLRSVPVATYGQVSGPPVVRYSWPLTTVHPVLPGTSAANQRRPGGAGTGVWPA